MPSAGRAAGSPNRLMSWQSQQVPVVPGDSPTSSRRGIRCRSRGYKGVGAGACFWTASRNLDWTTVIKVPGRSTHAPAIGHHDRDHHNHHHPLQPIFEIPRGLSRPQLRNGWNALRSSPQASTQGQAERRWKRVPALQGRDPRQGAVLPTVSLSLASKRLGIAMGGPATHSYGSRSVQVGSWSLGILR